MFQYGTVAGGLEIEHRHGDGSWAVMERRDPHDAAEFDPEREWSRGHVYVCSCGDEVRVAAADGDAEPDRPGAA